jgi:hypothetical protein
MFMVFSCVALIVVIAAPMPLLCRHGADEAVRRRTPQQ